MMQADLTTFAYGRSPSFRDHDDPGYAGRGQPVDHIRRCAKCGCPLGRGGLLVMGLGLCCWSCFQEGNR